MQKIQMTYGKLPSDFLTQHAIRKYVKGKNILVVGGVGRDYNALRDYDPYIIDLTKIDNPKAFQQSITQKIPVKGLDTIILGDVIEHLIEDHKALHNIRQALKPDGVLIISIPLYSSLSKSDRRDTHYRIHTPKTIERLLEHCGFEITRTTYRGFANGMPDKNILTKIITHTLRIILPRKSFMEVCLAIDKILPETWTGAYGMILQAKKAQKLTDEAKNKQHYEI